jgi:hypothetical protein
MLVAGVQTGQMRGASARIRYYTFMKYLKCDKTDNLEEADVVYFQKKSSKDIIKLAWELKHKGKKIVYDCDDGDGKRDRKNRNDSAMFEVADVITTDTEERAKEFRKKTDTIVCVVPDCIDYNIDRNEHKIIHPEIITIGTFGTHKVLESTFNKIKLLPKFKNQYYITDRKISSYNKHGWKLILWNVDTFIKNIKKFDLCVLLHSENKLGELKSNNRLLVCMALGLPTIVSNTCAYAETMFFAGLDHCIISGKAKKTISMLLKYKTRIICSDKMHNYVWSVYSPERSAERLEFIFRRLYDSSL